MWVWRSLRWEACASLLQVCWSVRAAHEIQRPFWRNVKDFACVCCFELWINSFLGLSSQYHWFWDQCILESRLIQTPQDGSDLVSIFDTGWFCFTSQLPSARVSGCRPSLYPPCNPPLGLIATALFLVICRMALYTEVTYFNAGSWIFLICA